MAPMPARFIEEGRLGPACKRRAAGPHLLVFRGGRVRGSKAPRGSILQGRVLVGPSAGVAR